MLRLLHNSYLLALGTSYFKKKDFSYKQNQFIKDFPLLENILLKVYEVVKWRHFDQLQLCNF